MTKIRELPFSGYYEPKSRVTLVREEDAPRPMVLVWRKFMAADQALITLKQARQRGDQYTDLSPEYLDHCRSEVSRLALLWERTCRRCGYVRQNGRTQNVHLT